MKRNRKNRLWPLVLMVMISCWAVASPKPASASDANTVLVTAVPLGTLSVAGIAAASYLLYKNRLSQPVDAKGRLGYKGPGEFFIGGFFGGSFVPGTDWTYQGSQDFTARNMTIDPGVTGGIKLGYFLDRIPYFGVEAESSFGNHPQPSQTVALHPPVAGATAGRVPGQTLMAWTAALHLVGRYGFLPDQEVPFGRLQPYVGIGPGLVVLYGAEDSAKNFSLEVEAGLRYMFTKHLGGFLEYKFSKQWSAELDTQHVVPVTVNSSNAVFDFDRHQVVVGLSYHF